MLFEPIYIPLALSTGTCLRQGDLFYSAGLHRNHVLATANTGKIDDILDNIEKLCLLQKHPKPFEHEVPQGETDQSENTELVYFSVLASTLFFSGVQRKLLKFSILQLYCPKGISLMGNSGCLPRGNPAATESRYPT